MYQLQKNIYIYNINNIYGVDAQLVKNCRGGKLKVQGLLLPKASWKARVDFIHVFVFRHHHIIWNKIGITIPCIYFFNSPVYIFFISSTS